MIAVTFLRSRSSAYQEAVRQATTEAEIVRVEGGRLEAHFAVPEQLAPALTLWALVGAWRGAALRIGDRAILPDEGWRVGEVLTCAARAATFRPPARYCASGGGPVPCRYLIDRWAGRVQAAVQTGSLSALAAESGVWACPFARPASDAATVEAWLRGVAG